MRMTRSWCRPNPSLKPEGEKELNRGVASRFRFRMQELTDDCFRSDSHGDEPGGHNEVVRSTPPFGIQLLRHQSHNNGYCSDHDHDCATGDRLGSNVVVPVRHLVLVARRTRRRYNRHDCPMRTAWTARSRWTHKVRMDDNECRVAIRMSKLDGVLELVNLQIRFPWPNSGHRLG